LTCRTICRRKPLPPDVRHNIFLIVKEALTNALHMPGRRRFGCRPRFPRALEILVQDDGGISKPAMPPMGQAAGLGQHAPPRRGHRRNAGIAKHAGKGTTVRLAVHLV
jgi:hypothetical protein